MQICDAVGVHGRKLLKLLCPLWNVYMCVCVCVCVCVRVCVHTGLMKEVIFF